MIVLPVAKVGGGAGGGFGVSATALGVYVLKDGKVSWHPAVDVNKIIVGAQLVAVAALSLVGAVLKSRRADR